MWRNTNKYMGHIRDTKENPKCSHSLKNFGLKYIYMYLCLYISNESHSLGIVPRLQSPELLLV